MLTPKTPSSNLLVALSSLVFCFGISCAQDTATSPGSNVTQTPTSADPGNPASEQDPTANEQDPEGSETRATPTSETQSESLQVEISNTAPEVSEQVIWLSAEQTDDHKIQVKVFASIEDVFGLAFRIQANPSVLTLESATNEDALSNMFAQGRYFSAERVPGELRYGGARFSEAPDTPWENAWGDKGITLKEEPILTLMYTIAGAGEAPIRFSTTGRDYRINYTEFAEAQWIDTLVRITSSTQGGDDAI